MMTWRNYLTPLGRTVAVLAFLVLVGLWAVFVSGCASGAGGAGKGVTWYNPTTWFSGKAGSTAAKVEAKIDTAKDAAVGAAQKAAHETKEALDGVPASRATGVARSSNDVAVALLDQVAGPLTSAEASYLKEKVRLLISDLAEERARGEALLATGRAEVDKISGKLDELEAAKKKADKDLASAFERENGLANELRNERWWSWFWRISIGLAAILALGGWVYVRFTLGGLPTGLGRALNDLRSADPEAADKLTGALDIHLSRAEQSMIRIIRAKQPTHP